MAELAVDRFGQQLDELVEEVGAVDTAGQRGSMTRTNLVSPDPDPATLRPLTLVMQIRSYVSFSPYDHSNHTRSVSLSTPSTGSATRR